MSCDAGVCITCVTPCWPVAVILGTVVMIFPALPGVTTLVVRIVIGLLAPVGGEVTVSHTILNKYQIKC